MTLPTRPRAPWHSSTTRRLAIVRIGLPTLLACVFAAGPAMAATLVRNVATVARQTLDPRHGGHRADGAAQRSDGER